MLPDFQEILDNQGMSGIIGTLSEDYRLSNLDIFEMLVRDTNPDISNAISLDDEARNFLTTDIVSSILGSGVGPNTMEQLRMLPEFPTDPAGLNAFMRQFGNTLLPRASQPIGIASVGLTQISKALRLLAAKTGSNHRSTIRSGLMSTAAGLDAIAHYGGSYITDGIAASQIWDGIQSVWAWWRSQTNEQKQEASLEDKQLINTISSLENLIKNAGLIDKDSNMVSQLATALKVGNLSGTAKQILHTEYENHVLSLLKRQLQDVLNERLPLYQYTGMAMIDRATRKAGSTTLSGYPASAIGI